MRLKAARALVVAVAICLCTAWQSFSATDANATVDCSGYNGNYFDGYYVTAPNGPVEGTRATVNYRFGYLCDTITDQATNFHYTWVMTHDTTSPTPGSCTQGGGYAQIGYFRGYNGTPRLTAEYDIDGGYCGAGFVRTMGTAVGTSANASLWTYFNPNALRIDMNYDNSTLSSTNFNPYSYWGTASDWDAEWFGEVTTLASDMPGTNASRTTFRNMNVQGGNDGLYTSAIGTPQRRTDKPSPSMQPGLSGSSYWAWTNISSNGFDIFTMNPQS